MQRTKRWIGRRRSRTRWPMKSRMPSSSCWVLTIERRCATKLRRSRTPRLRRNRAPSEPARRPQQQISQRVKRRKTKPLHLPTRKRRPTSLRQAMRNGRCLAALMIFTPKAVAKLPPDQLARFRRWFTAFEAGRTDHADELDSTATKLGRLAGRAFAELKKRAEEPRE